MRKLDENNYMGNWKHAFVRLYDEYNAALGIGNWS